jgi:hypothetical protein
MEAIVLVALAVIVVWGAVVFLRGGPLSGCLVFMLAATCFGTDFYSIELGSFRLSVDRIAWALVMLQYVVWRQRGWTDPKPVRLTDGVAILFVAYVAIRTFTAPWPAAGPEPIVHLALWYVMPLGIYWAARQSRLDERQGLMILACLTLLGVYLAITVIAEYAEQW